MQDSKGAEVRVDSLVQGFVGSLPRSTFARVYFVSAWGWVGGLETESGKQVVMYPGRFLVRGDPRPPKQRTDVPKRLAR